MGRIVNARDQYGAKGDGVTNDSAAIQNAIVAAGTHGVVYLPHGTYPATNLAPLDGQTIVGDGRGTTLVRAETGPGGEVSSTVVIDCVNRHGMTIANLAIDLVAKRNFTTAIRFVPSDSNPANVPSFSTVEGCTFYDSWTGAITGDGEITMHSVLMQVVRDCRVLRCNGDRTQIKARGRRITIDGNFLTRPRNQGIAVVLTGDSEHFTGITISSNKIEGFEGVTAIYCGNDSGNTVALGEYSALDVIGNQIVGPWNQSLSGSAILLRPCRLSYGWRVEGNAMICTDVAFPFNQLGISMQSVDGAQIRDVSVSRNTFQNLDYFALAVSAHVRDLQINDNALHETRGIAIGARAGQSGAGACNAVISGNVISGRGNQGIDLATISEGCEYEVHHNHIRETGAGNSAGVRCTAAALGKVLGVRASGNRIKAAQYGFREEAGAGTIDGAYYHNDLRGCTTPLSVSGGAYTHENRLS